MVGIGYDKARHFMRDLDWKARVTMEGEILVHVEVYLPEKAPRAIERNVYTVRKDSARRLLPECRVCGSYTHETAIMCYDHDAADETFI